MSVFTDFLKKRYLPSGGGIANLNFGNIAKDIASAASIYGVINPNDSKGVASFFGTGEQQPIGYTGGIPNYTATRELVPNAFAQTYTTPTGAQVARRPGSAGRQYFTDTTFTPSTTEPFMGRTATQIAAANQAEQDDAVLFGQLLDSAETQRITNTTDATTDATLGLTPTYTGATTGATTDATAAAAALYKTFIDKYYGKTLTSADIAALVGSGYNLDQIAKSLSISGGGAAITTQHNANLAAAAAATAAATAETEAAPYNNFIKNYYNKKEGLTDADLLALHNSGYAVARLATTLKVDPTKLGDAITNARLNTVSKQDGYSKTEQDLVADLITSGKTNIGNVASKFGGKEIDVVEALLRGGYENPAQIATRRNTTEVDLITELLKTGKTTPEEVAAYYKKSNPTKYANLTSADVSRNLAAIRQQTIDAGLAAQKRTSFLDSLSPSQVANEINAGKLTIAEAVNFYKSRGYPGITEADVKANMKAMGYAGYAHGGLASLAPQNQGYYLGGTTDGMADQIPATIDNKQPAALSDGEFVVPADVVSHLGNGNSDAGAKNLYRMMERVRTDRTGRAKQGRQINPNNYLV